MRSDTNGVISAFEQTEEVCTVIRLADAETSEHDVTEALGKIGPGFSVYSAEILLPDSFEPLADLDIGCRITEGQVLGYDDQLAEVPKRQYADWNAVTAQMFLRMTSKRGCWLPLGRKLRWVVRSSP